MTCRIAEDYVVQAPRDCKKRLGYDGKKSGRKRDMTPEPPSQVQQVPYSEHDKEVVAATLIGEAGGEREPGMHAVVNVVMNRAGNDPARASQICLTPFSFSFWNGKDVAETIQNAKRHPCWNQALMLTTQALEKRLPDITGGANHFYNPRLANPPWAKEMRPTVMIGGHLFLKY